MSNLFAAGTRVRYTYPIGKTIPALIVRVDPDDDDTPYCVLPDDGMDMPRWSRAEQVASLAGTHEAPLPESHDVREWALIGKVCAGLNEAADSPAGTYFAPLAAWVIRAVREFDAAQGADRGRG